MQNWRFTIIDTASSSQIEPTPANDTLTWKWARSGDKTMRLLLDTRLLFRNADYQWLYAIEQGANRYNALEVIVERRCEGVWSEFWAGELLLRTCEWNVSRCEVSASLTPLDGARCYDEKKAETVNILNLGGAISAKTIAGYIEEVTCGPAYYASIFPSSLPQNDSCISAGFGWSLRRNIATGLTPSGGGDYNGYITTTWARERLDGVACVSGAPAPPQGDGWILLNNNCPTGCDWVRPVTTQIRSDSDFDPTDGAMDLKYDIGGVSDAGDVYEYDNGRLLTDVIDALVASCGYTVVSDFYGINPDATAPANDAYTEAAANMQQLAIWQKSDVKRPEADYNARRGEITLEQLLNNLKAIHQIDYRISGSTMRIEHVSYFDDADNGIDLVADHPSSVSGNYKYTYDDAAIPKRELFAFMDKHPQAGGYFDGDPIEYTRGSDDVTYNADRITTDLLLLRQYPDATTDDGFFLGSLFEYGGNYYFNWSDGYPNGPLAYSQLHRSFWIDARPQPAGTMNGSPTTFNSIRRNRRQTPIEVIKFCCSDLADFNPDQLVRSQMGWGEVEEATYDTKTETLTLTLTHI